MSAESPAPPNPPRAGPGRVRRWVVRPFVWGIVLLAALLVGLYFLIQGSFARSRAAALVVARTSVLLQRDIRVGEVDYTFFPLAFELRDVVVPGPRSGDRPLAVLPYVRVQASWRDLRQQVLQLEQVEVVEPRIYVQFNPDGTSNLPRLRRQRGGKARFQTRLGRFLVQGGTLELNHRRVPLEVDARGVWGRLVGAGEDRFQGLVTAQEVTVELPDARPYTVALSAKLDFAQKAARLRLPALRVAGPELQARGEGFFELREPRRGEIRFAAEGAAGLANRLGYLDQPVAGRFEADGRFSLYGERWDYAATVASPEVDFLDRTFRRVAAQLAGNPAGLRVEIERVIYAEGTIAGGVAIATGGEGAKPVEVDLSFQDLALRPLLADQQVPLRGVTGRASGELSYRFVTSEPLGGSGTARMRLRGRSGERGLPVAGEVPLTFEDGVLATDNARLTAPGQALVAGGSVDVEARTGSFRYRLTTDDLGGLAPLLPAAEAGGAAPPWLPTAGHGRAEGSVSFAASSYSAEVALDLEDVATASFAVDDVHGSFRLLPRAVEDLRMEAVRGPGALLVTGRIPLPQPEDAGGMPPGERLALSVDAERWPAATLAAFLPGGVPVEGELSGQAEVGGSFESLEGRADLTTTGLVVRGLAVGRVRAGVAFDGPAVRIEQGLVELPAGDVVVQGVVDRAAERLSLTVDAPALSLAGEPFASLLRGAAGEVGVAAAVEGTFDRPEATVTVVARDLALAGRPMGEAGRAEVLATWDGRTVRAEGSLLGFASFDGGGRLDRQGAAVGFEVRSDDLAAIARLAARQPIPGLEGAFDGMVSASADFGAGTWRGELLVTALAIEYEGRQIRNLEPIVASVTPGRLAIGSLYLAEPDSGTELFVNGTVGLAGDAPLDLHLQSTVAAEWAELAAPTLQIEGDLDLLATVKGTASAPVLNGQGELRGGELLLPNFPHALEEMNGTILFNRDRVVLDSLRAELGGGALRATGFVDLPKPGDDLDYALQLLADDLSLRYPEGFLVRGDAELAVVSTAGGGRIVRGAVDLDRAFYLEDVEVGTVQLLQRVLQRERVEVAAADPQLLATQLNVTIQGPDALRVRNNVADLTGDIDLTVRGTAARPVVFGQVELDPGGKLVYSENEYRIERGLLTFANPYRIDPVIDLVARTEVQSFDITLTISGTLDTRLNVDFATEAGLADLEVLSLLATGQSFEEEGTVAASGEQPGSRFSAQGFLAGQAASAVSKRVGKLFGFDRFRISPLAAETGSAISGVGVTVGKRLSRDLFVTYTSRPSSPEGGFLQAEWQITEGVMLVFTRENDDSYAVDVQWQRRF